MTRPSKRKTKIREQERDNCEKFAKKPRVVDDWGDNDDSGWDDELDVLNEKEDKYEKTKKSTYFDKYGPSGCFTKAAEGSAKITKFINKHRSTPEDFEEVLNNMEDEEQNHLDLNKRIENLRI
ncbi:hypothetical protein RhiirC2_713041 [Rhizophagus irregularis]|uniref:Uncharacterized protein n=1 Tax=Rhizophagus irregularis TaxID=588596 RepID=A0A2N1N4S8_9GLOM|nr:hypothetical protein RhiirC2_713041 [Rhizophagus irregularis]